LAWYIAIQLKKAFFESMTLSGKGVNQEKNPVKKISINSIAGLYPENIVNHSKNSVTKKLCGIERDKRVLVCLVKADNMTSYINRSARIYYTGKQFPSVIHLDSLYYFMPYIKGLGIRDLYLIKVARVGTKKEVHPSCDDNELRLVFEIEYIRQLFESYRPIHLNVWHTFTDITMNGLIKLNEAEEM
jgi:hypothetical protein